MMWRKCVCYKEQFARYVAIQSCGKGREDLRVASSVQYLPSTVSVCYFLQSITFLFNTLQYAKENCFLQGSQDLPFVILFMKMTHLLTKNALIYIRTFSTYRTVNTHCLGYKTKPINAVLGSNRCLFPDPHKTQIHCANRT